MSANTKRPDRPTARQIIEWCKSMCRESWLANYIHTTISFLPVSAAWFVLDHCTFVACRLDQLSDKLDPHDRASILKACVNPVGNSYCVMVPEGFETRSQLAAHFVPRMVALAWVYHHNPTMSIDDVLRRAEHQWQVWHSAWQCRVREGE